ncbi:MAG: DUF1552 domain-containing protein [Zetaproteobacteria bacterium]|nr:DUF1552 domain-containing protein [Zetaproteobacteria bacterium]
MNRCMPQQSIGLLRKLDKIHSRRNFLNFGFRCAVTGYGLHLPLLESFFSSDKAFAAQTESLKYFFLMYHPNGVLQDEVGNKEVFHPANDKTPQQNNFLKDCSMEPLNDFRQQMHLFKSLPSEAHFSGVGNDHIRAICSFQTGVALSNHKNVSHHISFDTRLADFFASQAQTRTVMDGLRIIGNPVLDPPNGPHYNNSFKNGLSFDKKGLLLSYTNNLARLSHKVLGLTGVGNVQA